MFLKKTAAAVMAAAMMISSAVAANTNIIKASAAQNRSGICAYNYIDIRNDADPDGACVGWLDGGDYVSILAEKYDYNGSLWYQINYDGLTGYVPAEAVSEFKNNDTSDNSGSSEDFESYLESEGFPESYKVYLRELHEQHPNWIFKAQHLGIDWNTAVQEETVIGRNLVHINALDSWKSTDKGAYNYSTGEWYELDSGWVAASDGIIKYYLDPRNFLSENYIFMFENLSYDPSVQTREGVEAILRGTFMDGYYTCPDTGEYISYADTFMEAAEESGVSPYHLASRCRNEQGVYGAPQSLGTAEGYEGYFNFFDVQAFATATLTAGQMGAKFASTYDDSLLLPWTNQYKSIIGGSIFLGNGYINKDQDTLYLQKFDMTDGGNGYFAHQYMTCVFGQANEAVSLLNAYSDEVLATAMEFKIPIYNNMPDELCQKPGYEWDSTENYNRSGAAAAATSTVTKSSASTSKSQDVNGDDRVNISDAIIVIAHISGKRQLSEDMRPKADIDSNGVVNIADAMRIVRTIKGL